VKYTGARDLRETGVRRECREAVLLALDVDAGHNLALDALGGRRLAFHGRWTDEEDEHEERRAPVG
jgi:hypothetical protein